MADIGRLARDLWMSTGSSNGQHNPAAVLDIIGFWIDCGTAAGDESHKGILSAVG